MLTGLQTKSKTALLSALICAGNNKDEPKYEVEVSSDSVEALDDWFDSIGGENNE